MICSTCRSENAADASFCIYCGSSLYRVCPQCKYRNIPTARFCVECGSDIASSGETHRTEGAQPKRPDILTTRIARDGERKFVTILFADIVDSTRLIEKMEPDEAAGQLFRVLDGMRDAVRRFDGTVNKMQGDGLMALFGAPIPQEDHAVRACCAALAMQEAVVRLGSTKIRIGIHTGEAVLQTIRNDLNSQYDAMGVAVHIAARIEQAAGSSGIGLTLATLQASRGMIDVESLGAREFKGLSQPIEVFALRGIRSVAVSQQFLGGQRLSGFVGRQNELVQLNNAFSQANSGSSPVVGIVGEAGAGKSRLAFEFIMECRRKKIPIFEARATAHGRVTPLQPVLELARSFFLISRGDTPEIGRARINSRLAGLGLIADGPTLMNFLGYRDAAGQPAAPVEHEELLAVFRRISAVVGQLTPAIVIFEDLHWLDEASEPFMREIVRGLARSKVLLLLNFRSSYRREWMEEPFYHQIILQPLRPSETEKLAVDLLGSDESTAPIREEIVDRAAGNPFFTEELVRALVDQGALAGTRGNHKRTLDFPVGTLPSTVRGVIGFRVDRLGMEEKLFLEGASVIGREFPVDAAASIVGLEASDARTQVNKLLELEMIYERTDRAIGLLAFKHPLVQEVTYASLVIDRRRSLHRRAAAVLATHFASSANEHAAVIAHHWDEGGEPTQAASHYMISAHWIAPRDPVQATRTWERVREIVTALPTAPHVNYMRMMACGQIINLSWRERTAIERLQPVYDEAIGIARQQKDVRSAAMLTMAYGRALLATGSADDYLAYIEEAQALSSDQANSSVAAMLVTVQSHAVGLAGFLNRALLLNERALESVDSIEPTDLRTLGFDPKYWLWALRARYLVLTENTIAAEELLARLITNGSQNVDSVHRVVALGARIDAASLDRNVAQAIDAANQLGGTSGMEKASPYLAVLSRYWFGVALLVANNWPDARRQLGAALTLARDSRAGLDMEPLILANLAEASRGDSIAQRLELAEEARISARRRSLRVAELFANTSLIRIQAEARVSVKEDHRLEFHRLVELTGASRLRLRVQEVAAIRI
jgi:class 3 adenylate cyclase/tetratricopeptide (TPR) repeat protein